MSVPHRCADPTRADWDSSAMLVILPLDVHCRTARAVDRGQISIRSNQVVHAGPGPTGQPTAGPRSAWRARPTATMAVDETGISRCGFYETY